MRGHSQLKTHIHCNNATVIGIANNTVKRQHPCSMEMHYFWVCDKVAQGAYTIRWHQGLENLADYQSKHHIGAHHRAICPWYLRNKNSPLVLPWATRPSTLKGCVGTLEGGYVRNVPLPRIPLRQSTSPLACAATLTESTETYCSKVPRIPTWNELTSSLEGLGKTKSMPFFPC